MNNKKINFIVKQIKCTIYYRQVLKVEKIDCVIEVPISNPKFLQNCCRMYILQNIYLFTEHSRVHTC